MAISHRFLRIPASSYVRRQVHAQSECTCHFDIVAPQILIIRIQSSPPCAPPPSDSSNTNVSSSSTRPPRPKRCTCSPFPFPPLPLPHMRTSFLTLTNVCDDPQALGSESPPRSRHRQRAQVLAREHNLCESKQHLTSVLNAKSQEINELPHLVTQLCEQASSHSQQHHQCTR